MTQDQNPLRLRACLHFLLHPALSAAEKCLLASRIDAPEHALSPQSPLPLGDRAAQWQQWLAPLGRINTAADLIGQWLDTTPDTPAARSWICYWDPDYPPLLRSLARPPWLLLLEGRLPPEKAPVLAMVGSRNATRAGLRRAREFAGELASHGWVIASGLARGIDAAAHYGALDAGGHTVAVLGCGIDVVYPPEHDGLRRSILQSGGLIMSEYPPGTAPNEYFFPARNRIIAALSHGVLVVEAAVKSGSLITAHQANELGRAVMAMPGSLDTPQARGCHQMIRQGARLVETVADIHEELSGVLNSAVPVIENMASQQDRQHQRDTLNNQASVAAVSQAKPGRRSKKRPAAANLSLPELATHEVSHPTVTPPMHRLLSLFDGNPMQFDEISTTCKLPVQQLSALLMQLELAGLLEGRPGQWWAPV